MERSGPAQRSTEAARHEYVRSDMVAMAFWNNIFILVSFYYPSECVFRVRYVGVWLGQE